MGNISKFIAIILIIFGIINIIDGFQGGSSIFGGGGIEVTIGSYLVGLGLIVIGIVLWRRN